MNFGLIGFGAMGKIRCDVINGMSEHQVVKIYDPGLSSVPKDVTAVYSHLDILTDPDIECVIIGVPNYLIKDYVVEALNHKKHVFCEKPPGINVDDVLAMMKAEKENPTCRLMFGFNHRHHDSMQHAKELIDSGRFGKLLWLRGRYGKSVPQDFHQNWRSSKEKAGGGILLDQGIHMLDLFLMMVGEFDQVKAFVSNLYWHSDIEDNVFAVLKNSKTGQVASFHSTMTQWRHLFSLEMFLEKGYITINGLLTRSGTYGKESMTIVENRTAAPAATWSKEENIVFTVNTSWESEVKMFLNAVTSNEPIHFGTSQHALNVMQLIEKIYADG